LGSCMREGNITAASNVCQHSEHQLAASSPITSFGNRALAVKFPDARFPLMCGHGGTPVYINLHRKAAWDQDPCLSARTPMMTWHQTLNTRVPYHTTPQEKGKKKETDLVD
jgi:hypothetical protein